MDALRVAILQTSAGPEPETNWKRVGALLNQAPDCDVLALPEVFGVRGAHDDYIRAAEPVPGPTTERLAAAARARGAWILAGSIIEKSGDGVFNTCLLFDRMGTLTAAYRKIHLFEAYLDNGQVVRECDDYLPGDEPVLAELEGWRCGLSICYDMRFPELYRHYVSLGASLFFVPSNFTQRTGQDHWETLVRARAIENQCYVIAPGQCGLNVRTGIASHGNSMAVDPWGDIIARAGNEEGVITADLDPQRLRQTRARIPVLTHRRIP